MANKYRPIAGGPFPNPYDAMGVTADAGSISALGEMLRNLPPEQIQQGLALLKSQQVSRFPGDLGGGGTVTDDMWQVPGRGFNTPLMQDHVGGFLGGGALTDPFADDVGLAPPMDGPGESPSVDYFGDMPELDVPLTSPDGSRYIGNALPPAQMRHAGAGPDGLQQLNGDMFDFLRSGQLMKNSPSTVLETGRPGWRNTSDRPLDSMTMAEQFPDGMPQADPFLDGMTMEEPAGAEMSLYAPSGPDQSGMYPAVGGSALGDLMQWRPTGVREVPPFVGPPDLRDQNFVGPPDLRDQNFVGPPDLQDPNFVGPPDLRDFGGLEDAYNQAGMDTRPQGRAVEYQPPLGQGALLDAGYQGGLDSRVPGGLPDEYGQQALEYAVERSRIDSRTPGQPRLMPVPGTDQMIERTPLARDVEARGPVAVADAQEVVNRLAQQPVAPRRQTGPAQGSASSFSDTEQGAGNSALAFTNETMQAQPQQYPTLRETPEEKGKGYLQTGFDTTADIINATVGKDGLMGLLDETLLMPFQRMTWHPRAATEAQVYTTIGRAGGITPAEAEWDIQSKLNALPAGHRQKAEQLLRSHPAMANAQRSTAINASGRPGNPSGQGIPEWQSGAVEMMRSLQRENGINEGMGLMQGLAMKRIEDAAQQRKDFESVVGGLGDRFTLEKAESDARYADPLNQALLAERNATAAYRNAGGANGNSAVLANLRTEAARFRAQGEMAKAQAAEAKDADLRQGRETLEALDARRAAGENVPRDEYARAMAQAGFGSFAGTYLGQPTPNEQALRDEGKRLENDKLRREASEAKKEREFTETFAEIIESKKESDPELYARTKTAFALYRMGQPDALVKIIGENKIIVRATVDQMKATTEASKANTRRRDQESASTQSEQAARGRFTSGLPPRVIAAFESGDSRAVDFAVASLKEEEQNAALDAFAIAASDSNASAHEVVALAIVAGVDGAAEYTPQLQLLKTQEGEQKFFDGILQEEYQRPGSIHPALFALASNRRLGPGASPGAAATAPWLWFNSDVVGPSPGPR